jgi:hypothetical protein
MEETRKIIYKATLEDGVTVSWEREGVLHGNFNVEEGPGHILCSMKVGAAGGIVVRDSFIPLCRIRRITWEVR